MGGTWAYPKTWLDLENLTNEDLNAQFQTVLDNADLQGLGSYETDVGQMQIQTSPGGLGNEVLAASFAQEIEQIRYQISKMLGLTYWYETVPASLGGKKPNVIFSLPFTGPDAYTVMKDCISRGCTTDLQMLQGTNKKFGDFVPDFATGVPFTLGIPSDPIAISGKSLPYSKECLTMWFRNYPSNHNLAFNIQKGIYLRLNSLGRLETSIQLPVPATQNSKQILGTSHTNNVANLATWTNAIFNLRQNGIAGVGQDNIQSFVNGIDSQQNGTNIALNFGDGGIWFFGADKTDPAWDKFSAFSVLPSAESVDPWTFGAGTAAYFSVANGLLTLTPNVAASPQATYIRTNHVDLTAQTIECKIKLVLGANPLNNIHDTPFGIKVIDSVLGRSAYIGFMQDRIFLVDSDQNPTGYKTFFIDNTQFHVYRFVFSGSPNPTLTVYCDGISIGSITLQAADARGSEISFGCYSTLTGISTKSVLEWFSVATTSQAPVSNLVVPGPSFSGQIDDLFSEQEYLNSDQVKAIQNYAARIALGQDRKFGDFSKFRGTVLVPEYRAGTYSIPVSPNWQTITSFTPLVSDGFKKVNVKVKGSGINGAGSHVHYALKISSRFYDLALGLQTYDVDPGMAGYPFNYYLIGGAEGLIQGADYTPFSVEKTAIVPPGIFTITLLARVDGGAGGTIDQGSLRAFVSYGD